MERITAAIAPMAYRLEAIHPTDHDVTGTMRAGSEATASVIGRRTVKTEPLPTVLCGRRKRRPLRNLGIYARPLFC